MGNSIPRPRFEIVDRFNDRRIEMIDLLNGFENTIHFALQDARWEIGILRSKAAYERTQRLPMPSNCKPEEWMAKIRFFRLVEEIENNAYADCEDNGQRPATEFWDELFSSKIEMNSEQQQRQSNQNQHGEWVPRTSMMKTIQELEEYNTEWKDRKITMELWATLPYNVLVDVDN